MSRHFIQCHIVNQLHVRSDDIFGTLYNLDCICIVANLHLHAGSAEFSLSDGPEEPTVQDHFPLAQNLPRQLL